MANEVEVRVDDTGARLKLRRVPVTVRDELRKVIPDLVRQIAALVNSKLGSELKSRQTLSVTTEMHDVGGARNEIYGLVRMTSPSANGLLPTYLEKGTSRHWVEPVTAKALHWITPAGEDAFSGGHFVKGIKAYRFMGRSLDEMSDEIVETLRAAAKRGGARA